MLIVAKGWKMRNLHGIDTFEVLYIGTHFHILWLASEATKLSLGSGQGFRWESSHDYSRDGGVDGICCIAVAILVECRSSRCGDCLSVASSDGSRYSSCFERFAVDLSCCCVEVVASITLYRLAEDSHAANVCDYTEAC